MQVMTKHRPNTGHDEILVAQFTIDLHLSTASYNRLGEIVMEVGDPDLLAAIGKAVSGVIRQNSTVRKAIQRAANTAADGVVSANRYTVGLVATVRD